MNDDDDKGKYLNYHASSFSALVIIILSLFVQCGSWFIFLKSGMSRILFILMPLILCIMYHFVQLDAGKHGNFSREFFFICAVAAPCIFSLVMFFITFDLDSVDNSTRGTIAKYSARIMFTSVFLIIFALIDIPVLRHLDKKEKKD
ncbi:MAG: hypothetical protein IKO47_12525 [Ruminococcus sp.]|nr:hypothetical protein [Ruminococcus sp.]